MREQLTFLHAPCIRLRVSVNDGEKLESEANSGRDRLKRRVEEICGMRE